LARLRPDPPEILHRNLFFEVVPHADVRIELARVDEPHLALVVGHLGIGQHQPTPPGAIGAGGAVDLHAHVGVFMQMLLGGRGERRFQGGEDHVLGDVLFMGQRIDQQQQFATHCFLPPKPSN